MRHQHKTEYGLAYYIEKKELWKLPRFQKVFEAIETRWNQRITRRSRFEGQHICYIDMTCHLKKNLQ